MTLPVRPASTDPHDRGLEEVLRLKHTGLEGASKLSSLGHSLRQSRRHSLMRAQMYLLSDEGQPPRSSKAVPSPSKASSWSLAQPRCGLQLALVGKTPPTTDSHCPHLTSNQASLTFGR